MSSQAGSSEVSKKLKAAIRAKLEELGVYVDDELPDYIMVMIANKKEKSQMKDDLSLFIGKSTAKFVDWLFDLFDRLQNASSSSSKPGESSRKEEEKNKEVEQKDREEKHREEKHRKEKEDRDREEVQREKEREREKERQRERDREKRQEDEKRREEKRREAQKTIRRRTRSRSNTYSDGESNQRIRDKERRGREHRGRSAERKKVPSTVMRPPSGSPEPQKVQSTVVVKRNIRPTGDANVRGRGSMFLRAMNEASVSAGASSSKRSKDSEGHDDRDDDMSDVEALPSKTTKSPKKSIHERMSRVATNSGTGTGNASGDCVVLGSQPQAGGPQVIVKLAGGKEAIKRTRIQERIVVDDSLRRGLLKRRMEVSDEPKSKHERITFDVETPSSRDTTPTDGSPTMQKWNGQIKLGEDSDSSDEEAEIDALVAEARGIARRDSVREEEAELLPTHELVGKTFAAQRYHQSSIVPTYVPTPLSVLQEQRNQVTVVKEDQHVKERCVFWPKCTKGDACQFMHPTKNCTNFPNCSYGIRCLFIHPACRFDRFCTKKHCPYTHHGTGGVQPGQQAPPPSETTNPLTSNRIAPKPVEVPKLEDLPKPLVRGTLGSLAEKLAASLKRKVVEKKEEKSDENEKKEVPAIVAKPPAKTLPEIAPLQNMIPCRYAGGCRNPVCHFKHPKECRFGTNCRNASCYFYHKPTAPVAPTAPISTEGAGATAKYKWTAAAATTAP
uniref:Zinc finger CCCH domain-containing protein 14 n=1 Tax=Caenorhabditis japonica TaxID=281687 RepID=A0A8R1DGD5_CAEJA